MSRGTGDDRGTGDGRGAARDRDGRADGATGRPDDPPAGDRGGEPIEVRVLALGVGDGSQWFATGRVEAGTTVTFLIDESAALAISDALAAGDEPVALIEPRQVL